MSTSLDKQPMDEHNPTDELLDGIEQDDLPIETIHPDILRFKVALLNYLLNKNNQHCLTALNQAGAAIPIDAPYIQQLKTVMKDSYILQADLNHLQKQLIDTRLYAGKNIELILLTLINHWQRNAQLQVDTKHKTHMREYYTIVGTTTQIQQDAKRLLEQGKTLDGCSASAIAHTLNRGAASFGMSLHKGSVNATGLTSARYQAELGLQYHSLESVPKLKVKILNIINFIDDLIPVKETMLILFPSLVSAQASLHIEATLNTADKALTKDKPHKQPINPLIL